MNKICTDIEQSKKLAEFLPLESADGFYAENVIITEPFITYLNGERNIPAYKGAIPCWSLAALLAVMPATCDDGRHCLSLINSNPNGDVDWLCCYEDCNGNLLMECYGINQVDACYEMIIKLHEQKML